LKNLDGTFSSGLSEVLKINPIRYRYKEQNGMGISDHEEHIGVVAQEIQKVIPEAVSENSKGYLLVNNDPIIWAMLNAIKEQQRQIQAQGEQIKQQQKQIHLARKRVEEQESATAVLRQQLHQQRAHNAALESRLIHLEKNQSAGATRIALNQKSLPLTQSRNER
jgi:predicted RNase H-like nuclease (RuvC/YqgF family)